MTTDNYEEGLDLRRYWRVLTHAKGLILTFCLSATLTSLALTYVFAEKYAASVSILYQPNDNVTFRPKAAEALGFPTPLVTLESIATTVEQVALSDGVIAEVVRRLKLDAKRPAPPAPPLVVAFREAKDEVKALGVKTWQILRYGRILRADPFVQAAATLRANLRINRTSRAYTFQLEAISNYPDLSAAVADCTAEVLSQFLIDERRRFAKEMRSSIEARLLQNEQEIVHLRQRIAQFKQDTSVSSLSEEVSLKLNAVAGYEEALARTRADLNGLQRKRDEIRQQLEREERFVPYESTNAQNPIAQDLRLALARLQVERSGLLDKMTESHPEVTSLDARIAELRRRLNTESGKVVSSESTRLNDIYQRLVSDRLAAEADILALNEKIRSYASAIKRESSFTHDLTSKEQALADLTLQLAGAERSYAMIGQAREEARMAESNIGPEMSILHKAGIPIAPVRPIKILHAGLSAMLSLVLAIGMAFLFDFFDTTLRTLGQLHQVLKVPVLGTIPAVPHPKRRRRTTAHGSYATGTRTGLTR